MSAAWFQGVIATGVDEKGDVRADLLHVLRLPDFDRAERIGEFWGHPETRTFGELLIDLEEDKAARPVVFGLLREMERK